jgi:protocatechuate 3,4-dioxygenase beta subunit
MAGPRTIALVAAGLAVLAGAWAASAPGLRSGARRRDGDGPVADPTLVARAGDPAASARAEDAPDVAYEGTVVDEDGGAVGGALVVVAPGGATRSDDAGRFRVTGPAAAPRSAVAASHGDLAPGFLLLGAQDERRGLVLRLGPATSLSGRVVDARGSALAGSRVELRIGSPMGEEGAFEAFEALREHRSWEATADPEGRFRFVGLMPDVYVASAEVAGAPRAFAPAVAVDRLRPEAEVVIVVVDATVLRGVVTDDAGAPVEGAEVTAGAGEEADAVLTDALGAFALDVAAGTPVRLVVRADDCAPWASEVDPLDGQVRVVLVRCVATRVRLVLVGGGDPPDEVVVRVVRARDAGGIPDTLRVEQGVAAAEWALSAGDHVLHVEGPTHVSGPFPFRVARAGAEVSLRVPLEPALTLEGTVRDASGVPVVAAPVTLERLGGNGRAVTATDEDGRFVFGGLPPGRCSVSAEAFGPHGGAALETKVGKRDVVLVVEEVVAVSGEVTGLRGIALPDDPLGLLAVFEPTTEGAVSRSIGCLEARFRISLRAGEYLAWAQHGALRGKSVRILARAGQDVADLRLEPPPPGLRITGRVLTPAGTPCSAGHVTARRRDEREGDSVHARIGDDGRFTLVGLDAGEHVLDARSDGDGARLEPVVAGATDVEIRLVAHAKARGKVHGLRPQDLPDLEVTAWGDGRLVWAEVGLDGGFSFVLPPGTWVLSATAGPRYAPAASVELGPGASVRGLRLDAVEGATLEVVFRDAAGRVPEEAWVHVGKDGAAAPDPGPQDAEGRFRFEGLAPGTWRVSAGLDESRVDVRSTVEVRAGAVTRLALAPPR